MSYLSAAAVVFPTAEIYTGKQAFAGFYTFGPIGTLLIEEIKEAWRDRFIRRRDRVFEISGTILTPRIVWKASGHLECFWDPVVECTKCGRVYRADHLVEDELGMSVEGKTIEELDEMIRKNGIACPRCGGELSEVRRHFLMFQTHAGVERIGEEANAILRPETAQVIFLSYPKIRMTFTSPPFGIAQIGRSFRNEISPRRGLFRLREFQQMEIEYFVLRKATCIPFERERALEKGLVKEGEEGEYRFRPKCLDCKECQINNCPYFDEKLRRTVVRIYTAEAQLKGSEEVLEIEAEKAVEEGILPNEWMAYVLAEETAYFVEDLGIPPECMRFRQMLPEEVPHYSAGNFDLEILFSFGWKEVVGNAYRTDYDLSNHMRESGYEMYEQYEGAKVVPHVVEPSLGIERMVLAIASYAYVREGVDRPYPWLRLPPRIAPVKAAVLPLMMPRGKEEAEQRIGMQIRETLLEETHYFVAYDASGSIGSRYRKYDQWGVPFCITVDAQSIEDGTVTIRNRDDKSQVRVGIDEVPSIIAKLVKGRISFEDLK